MLLKNNQIAALSVLWNRYIYIDSTSPNELSQQENDISMNGDGPSNISLNESEISIEIQESDEMINSIVDQLYEVKDNAMNINDLYNFLYHFVLRYISTKDRAVCLIIATYPIETLWVDLQLLPEAVHEKYACLITELVAALVLHLQLL